MKKFIMMFSVFLLALFVTACGDDDEVTETPETDANTEVVDDDDAMDDASDAVEGTDDDVTNEGSESAYPFRSFELDVDIENDDDAVEVDYDAEWDETEVSYRHQPKGIQLSGDEALAELDPIFSSFQFDKDTPKEEVIQKVLEAFEIPENAIEIDLEIEFNDGTEMEYDR